MSEKAVLWAAETADLVADHGGGMADEYPHCAHLVDFEKSGYHGVFEPGMTVCIVSYVGEVGGDEGVKLEQQVLITETGVELLSSYPFEDELLEHEIQIGDRGADGRFHPHAYIIRIRELIWKSAGSLVKRQVYVSAARRRRRAGG